MGLLQKANLSSECVFVFNWQVKIIYIYGVQHATLIYAYIVEWLNQDFQHVLLHILIVLWLKSFKITVLAVFRHTVC